jgi:hypothetical protein
VAITVAFALLWPIFTYGVDAFIKLSHVTLA